MLIVFSALCVRSVQGSAYVQVAASPDVVQSPNAALEIGWALSKKVEAGGHVRITFPAVMAVSADFDASSCREVDGLVSFSACRANIEKNYIEFVMKTAIELDGTTSRPCVVSVSKAVKLPTTIATADPITLTTSAGEVRSTTFKATAGTLSTASLVPTSQVVGSDTVLRVSLTTKHGIPKKGKLHISASAAWNDGALGSPVHYFSSITCNSFTIAGASVPAGSYVCSVFSAFGGKGARVEIDGGFRSAGGASAGTSIKINIVGFRNPTLANVPFNVFTVYTTGEDVSHTIDTKAVAITVTESAALTGGLFEVSPPEVQADNRGVVQEPNTMRLRFSSPVPLRKGCTVSYWFPTEFYDADDILYVRLGALFA